MQNLPTGPYSRCSVILSHVVMPNELNVITLMISYNISNMKCYYNPIDKKSRFMLWVYSECNILIDSLEKALSPELLRDGSDTYST